MAFQGDEFRAIVHSTDASSGVAIPIYDRGSNTARTIASNEFIQVSSVLIVSAAGGDCYVLAGADATLGTGETIARGTVGANGGIAHNFIGTQWGSTAGFTLWVVAPAGVVDVVVTGRITQM